MTPKVFISVGSHPTPQQATAIEALFNTLSAAGLDPRQMDKNEWSFKQPLRAIKEVINDCHGLVLVAFTRFKVIDGWERKEKGPTSINGDQMPTVWNQIEATMAYVRGLPFLVIAENGLRGDGLLEARYEWNVYPTDFSEADFRSERFAGWVKSWKVEVLRHAEDAQRKPMDVDAASLSIRALLSRMTIPQLWGFLTAILGALGAVATAAYLVGGGKWPWESSS